MDPPDWVERYGDSPQHPDHVYLTGWGMAATDDGTTRDEAMQLALENARSDLAQSLRATITSDVYTRMEEAGSEVQQYFSSVTETSASLQVQGLDDERYFDEGQGEAHALVHVRRERVIGLYEDRIEELEQDIRERIERAESYRRDGDHSRARRELAGCFQLLRELEKSSGIIAAARSEMTEAFAALDRGVDDMIRVHSDLQGIVRSRIDNLQDEPVRSLEDLGSQLSLMLGEQLPAGNDEAVMVLPFDYEDTNMGSSFSQYFNRVFQVRLTDTTPLGVVEGGSAGPQSGRQERQTEQAVARSGAASGGSLNIEAERARQAGAEFYITGSYWEEQDGLNVMATVYRSADGRSVASAEITVPMQVVEATGRAIRPDNYEQASRDNELYRQYETRSSGLNLDVWTDRGQSSITYTSGDRPEIYVRVSREAHVRVIYHLPDGRRTMLHETRLDGEQVNRPYAVHEAVGLAVDEPYGTGFLQVVASTEELNPVRTRREDGLILMAGDLEEDLARTRSIVQEREQDNVPTASMRLPVTTIAEDSK